MRLRHLVPFLALPLLAAGPCGTTDGCGDRQQQITNVFVGPLGPSGSTGPAPAPVDFRCQRASCTGVGAASCSSIACTWAGGGVFDLCAQDATLGRFCLHSSSPGEIDPGPTGAGAGSWRMTLEQGGVVLAEAPEVTTDT